MEGVMMKSPTGIAMAVREPDGNIALEYRPFASRAKKGTFLGLPIVRGVVAFVEAISEGMGTLTRSAELAGESIEEEPSKFEKWLAEKLGKSLEKVIIALAVILAVVLSVGLFFLLPQLISSGIFSLLPGSDLGKSLTEGLVRLLIFIGYILFCASVKDVRRIFMYHGAEHKTIACYEAEAELTPENAMHYTRLHPRCGTNYLFLVMAVSILFFAVVGWNANFWVRLLSRLLFLPLVAGLSYELLRFAAKYDNLLTRIIRAPGMALQYITTKEPTRDMLEVAIAAFHLAMLPEEEALAMGTAALEATSGESARFEARQLLAHGMGLARLPLSLDASLSPAQEAAYRESLERRLAGEPLQYILGQWEFMGLPFYVGPAALIPRPDTETLCEAVLARRPKGRGVKLLDLCCGTGCIGLSLGKLGGFAPTLTDISPQCLALAQRNARLNQVEARFFQGDLFAALPQGETFGVICANPPYIPAGEIPGLQREVGREPRLALDGGPDGLAFYRRIAQGYRAHLAPGGLLALELGAGQFPAVQALFGGGTAVKDVCGHDRVILLEHEEDPC